MYVYPVTDVALPDSWLEFAPLAPEPFTVDPSLISQNRDDWIQTWTDTVIG
jgi:thiamine transport system substrate-binding protein